MWIDDIGTRIEQAGKKIGNDIGSYLSSIKIEPTVLIGQPADGNKTAAEIEAQNEAAKFAMGGSILMILSVAGVAYLLFFNKNKKGKK